MFRRFLKVPILTFKKATIADNFASHGNYCFSMLKVTKYLYFDRIFTEHPYRPGWHHLQKFCIVRTNNFFNLKKRLSNLTNTKCDFSCAILLHDSCLPCLICIFFHEIFKETWIQLYLLCLLSLWITHFEMH